MRTVFAHDAVLNMAPDADLRAPGGAITVALCGSWNHAPPCPLAPHHTHAERKADEAHLHILFAAEPEQELTVRQLIDGALRAGCLLGPDGALSRWRLRSSQPA